MSRLIYSSFIPKHCTDVDTSHSYHITESAATLFWSVQLHASASELLKLVSQMQSQIAILAFCPRPCLQG